MFELIPYEKFRDTPAVRFFDITVAESNARDLVIHSGPAVSPPDEENTGAWQFYLHPHQEDNLLALHGGRTFYLVNFGWNYPYHIVRLDTGGDILRILLDTAHFIAGADGNLFVRTVVSVQVGAEVVPAWTYVCGDTLAPGPVIASGDWRTHLGRREGFLAALAQCYRQAGAADPWAPGLPLQQALAEGRVDEAALARELRLAAPLCD